MTEDPDVLIVDDDSAMRALLRKLLRRVGLEAVEAVDGLDALEKLRQRSFELVITDLVMPRSDGLEVLRHMREHHPKTPVLILTAESSVRQCVKAMQAGALNFLTKPFHPPELEEIVRLAVPRRGSDAAAPSPRSGEEQSRAALVGESVPIRTIIDTIERIAHVNATVLITGESGTGKEIVARLLHGSSPRAREALIAVNCGAIPENLIESELFGHARGAFTGATEARPGRFQQAHGGTLFLDEIGELPFALQVKLLRVLQEREVTPVGDSRVRPVDVRIVAATNQDLEAMVKAGKFRADLFYRLEVVRLHLPALRERREDIPLLARHFLKSMNQRFDREVALGDDALAVMTAYAWPGNVREMENLFERLVLLARGNMIHVDDLPARLREASAETAAVAVAAKRLRNGSIDFEGAVAGFETSLIEQALRQARGNKSRAAEILGLSRTTFIDKLKR
jgi:two-component system response regulator AtoC